VSINKHYRQAWIETVYAQAVDLFHRARKDNEDNLPLVDLARAAANTAFADNAKNIVGDKESMAREFMRHCRDNFATEISTAAAAQARAVTQSPQPEVRAN
jgi:hypothetical protein